MVSFVPLATLLSALLILLSLPSAHAWPCGLNAITSTNGVLKVNNPNANQETSSGKVSLTLGGCTFPSSGSPSFKTALQITTIGTGDTVVAKLNGAVSVPVKANSMNYNSKFTVGDFTLTSALNKLVVTITNPSVKNGGCPYEYTFTIPCTTPPPQNQDCECSDWEDSKDYCDSKGFKLQTRYVKKPKYGNGKECGDLTRQQPCPVDCDYQWQDDSSDAGQCNKNKDGKKHQLCKVNKWPSNGGKDCPKDRDVDCPVDCQVSDWVKDKDCINGQQWYKRSITQQSMNGGKACPELTHSFPCTPTKDCQVCDWDAGVCDPSTGKQKQTRVIVTAPSGSGKACPNLEQYLDCKVDCKLSDWTYGACVNGTKTGTRTVLTPPRNGGAACGPMSISAPCPQNCILGDWTNDGECKIGMQAQKRDVLVPAANDGVACGDVTRSVPCSSPCVQSDWYNFGVCDATTGQQEQHRDIVHDCHNGGTPCGDVKRYVPCKVDCSLSGWENNGECEADGQKQKRRVMVQPKNGGAVCGPLDQKVPCDRDCEMTDWIPDGNCTMGWQWHKRSVKHAKCGRGADCGDVSRKITCALDCIWQWKDDGDCKDGKRKQSCSVIVPAANGGKCDLPSPRFIDCHLPVDCGCSAWVEGQCVNGRRTRTRTILTQPQWGGAECPALQDEVPCTQQCQLSDWTNMGACINGVQVQTRSITQWPTGDAPPCPEQIRNVPCKVDCQVCDWYNVGECSNGKQQQQRVITVQPLNGGAACPDQTRAIDCTQNCVLGPWYNLGSCSNDGKQQQKRDILQPALNGGLPCGTQTQTVDCPVNCGCGDWQNQGVCTQGQQQQTRPVLVKPLNGGAACGDVSRTIICTEMCEVSDWSNYGSCSNGQQVQTRSITQHPSNGAPACPPLQQTVPCNQDCKTTDWYNVGNCVSGKQQQKRDILQAAAGSGAACPALQQFLDCAVDCQMSDWIASGSCSNEGKQLWTRNVIVPAQNGGLACPAQQKTTDCAVDCLCSEWTNSGTCTNGLQSQVRTVLIPRFDGGAYCPELQRTIPCRQDCAVSDWSNLGECYNGAQIQTRSITVYPALGGASCPDCVRVLPCAVDCQVGDWSNSGSCQNGVQLQTRPVLVAAKNGGAACPVQSQTTSCPSVCQVSEWENTGTCSANGLQLQTRSVTVQGSNCPALQQTVSCIPNVDCRVGGWANVGTCINSQQLQVRSILQYPTGLGAACPACTQFIPCQGASEEPAVDICPLVTFTYAVTSSADNTSVHIDFQETTLSKIVDLVDFHVTINAEMVAGSGSVRHPQYNYRMVPRGNGKFELDFPTGIDAVTLAGANYLQYFFTYVDTATGQGCDSDSYLFRRRPGTNTVAATTCSASDYSQNTVAVGSTGLYVEFRNLVQEAVIASGDMELIEHHMMDFVDVHFTIVSSTVNGQFNYRMDADVSEIGLYSFSMPSTDGVIVPADAMVTYFFTYCSAMTDCNSASFTITKSPSNEVVTNPPSSCPAVSFQSDFTVTALANQESSIEIKFTSTGTTLAKWVTVHLQLCSCLVQAGSGALANEINVVLVDIGNGVFRGVISSQTTGISISIASYVTYYFSYGSTEGINCNTDKQTYGIAPALKAAKHILDASDAFALVSSSSSTGAISASSSTAAASNNGNNNGNGNTDQVNGLTGGAVGTQSNPTPSSKNAAPAFASVDVRVLMVTMAAAFIGMRRL